MSHSPGDILGAPAHAPTAAQPVAAPPAGGRFARWVGLHATAGTGTTLPRSRPLLLYAAAAFLLPLIYALVTSQILEDFFITFRHSENLVNGHGLTFNPPERVHGFTSPIGVLLPALIYWLTGRDSYVEALWGFRILSAFAYTGAALLILRAASDFLRRPFFFWLLGLLFLLEPKALAFSANGQETAFMLLFVAWMVHLWTREDGGSWLAHGLCWAGLLWTRPDGALYIALFAIVTLAAGRGDLRHRSATLLKAAGVCTLAYLPWFVGAWVYYGSPVPNTILAKSMDALHVANGVISRELDPLGSRASSWADFLIRLAQRVLSVLGRLYLGTYQLFPEAPVLARWTAAGTAAFAAVYWLVPRGDRVGRMASFAFFFLVIYLAWVSFPFPWYQPPAALLGLVTLVRGFALLEEAASRRGLPAIARAIPFIALAIALNLAFLSAANWRTMRVQQREIEDGVRTRIGLWLKHNARPGDTVYLEPVGYIGYFSQGHIVDFPGLVAPRVIELRRQGYRTMIDPIPLLEPTWIVLRPYETRWAARSAFFKANYAYVRSFHAGPGLDAYPDLADRLLFRTDYMYHIFRANPASDQGDRPPALAPDPPAEAGSAGSAALVRPAFSR